MSLQATKTGPDAQAAKILENRVPDRIGKYVIINEVGRGSTGTVYLSHDPFYGRDVAIKVYNMDHEQSDERAKIARKMFSRKRTWSACCSTAHPSDLRRGRGKRPLLHRHRTRARSADASAYRRPDNLLRTDDVVEIMFKCAKALHYAPRAGDPPDIKPSNIMLTQDSDIIDFASPCGRLGISHRGHRGSPSPCHSEQGRAWSHASLRPVLAGRRDVRAADRYPPFRAGNLVKLLHQIVYATPPPIHT
jgi:serine/threonine protein kinase